MLLVDSFKVSAGVASSLFLHDLHCVPISYRIRSKVLCYAHCVIYEPFSLPLYIRSLFELNKSARLINLIIPKVRTNFGKRSLKFFGAQLWNSPPQN